MFNYIYVLCMYCMYVIMYRKNVMKWLSQIRERLQPQESYVFDKSSNLHGSYVASQSCRESNLFILISNV